MQKHPFIIPGILMVVFLLAWSYGLPMFIFDNQVFITKNDTGHTVVLFPGVYWLKLPSALALRSIPNGVITVDSKEPTIDNSNYLISPAYLTKDGNPIFWKYQITIQFSRKTPENFIPLSTDWFDHLQQVVEKGLWKSTSSRSAQQVLDPQNRITIEEEVDTYFRSQIDTIPNISPTLHLDRPVFYFFRPK